jgi:hypothetical protein
MEQILSQYSEENLWVYSSVTPAAGSILLLEYLENSRVNSDETIANRV